MFSFLRQNISINPKVNTADSKCRELNMVGVPDRHAASIMSGNFIVEQQGGGRVVQRRVVNQNESRDLGNINTNIVLTNRTRSFN